MRSFIRSHRSALACLAAYTCLAVLLLLAVVGLFLAAFPAAAQNASPSGPNVALGGDAASDVLFERNQEQNGEHSVLPRSYRTNRFMQQRLLARCLSLDTARSRAEVQGKFPALEADTGE